MLDHVFTDAIGALRDAFEQARLERQAFEERFQSDVLLGDLMWQTSYGLPGEGQPPRVQADITCSWPTWSQTAYRSWYVEEEFTEPPRIEIEIVFRRQRLTETLSSTVDVERKNRRVWKGPLLIAIAQYRIDATSKDDAPTPGYPRRLEAVITADDIEIEQSFVEFRTRAAVGG